MSDAVYVSSSHEGVDDDDDDEISLSLSLYLVERQQVVVPAGPVDGHGGVQQPAQRRCLDHAHLLLVLWQVFAVRRCHEAAAAEQVG